MFCSLCLVQRNRSNQKSSLHWRETDVQDAKLEAMAKVLKIKSEELLWEARSASGISLEEEISGCLLLA